MPSFFLVSQNQSHEYEFQHKLLWSPKLNRKHGRNPGYVNMSHVRRGDIIFHVFNQKIHAVSVAKYDVYSSPKPLAYNGNIWDDDGWRVDCDMHKLEIPLSDHREWLNSHKGEVFDKNGRLKQQYLFELNQEQKNYFGHLIPSKLMESLLTDSTTSTIKVPNLREVNKNLSKKRVIGNNQIWIHDMLNDQAKDNVGKMGEQAVFKYLKKKYFESKYKIIPVSSNLAGKNGNDAAGYDILLKSNKGTTYIDVKTTTGSNHPFYMSVKERKILNSLKHCKNSTYNIYRVFEMSKAGNDTAKFEIYNEDTLEKANFHATNFLVTLTR